MKTPKVQRAEADEARCTAFFFFFFFFFIIEFLQDKNLIFLSRL